MSEAEPLTSGRGSDQKEGVFDETVLWKGPIDRGHWHDFVWHIKWSTDATIGFVELWHDGAHVLPKTYVRTLFSDGHAYLKQGYYRNSTIDWPGVLYHDGTNVGTSYDMVSPPPIGPTDAGASDAGPSDAALDASLEATVGDDATTPDVSDDAGSIDDGSTPDGADAGASEPGAPSDASSGCGCVLAGGDVVASSDVRWSAIVAIALVAVRRRSRRGQSAESRHV